MVLDLTGEGHPDKEIWVAGVELLSISTLAFVQSFFLFSLGPVWAMELINPPTQVFGLKARLKRL